MSSFDNLLTDRVVFDLLVGHDGNGDPKYGARHTIDAKVEGEIKKVTNTEGNEEVSRHRIASAVEIPIDSRVWLPGDDPDNEVLCKKPLAVARAATPDELELFETRL